AFSNIGWIRYTVLVLLVFFFQARDGIRGFHVTGVQTCALPIWRGGSRTVAGTTVSRPSRLTVRAQPASPVARNTTSVGTPARSRSEERRVGKERRSGRSPYEQHQHSAK